MLVVMQYPRRADGPAPVHDLARDRLRHDHGDVRHLPPDGLHDPAALPLPQPGHDGLDRLHGADRAGLHAGRQLRAARIHVRHVSGAGLRRDRLCGAQDRLPRLGDPDRGDPRSAAGAVFPARAAHQPGRRDGSVLVDAGQHPVGRAGRRRWRFPTWSSSAAPARRSRPAPKQRSMDRELRRTRADELPDQAPRRPGRPRRGRPGRGAGRLRLCGPHGPAERDVDHRRERPEEPAHRQPAEPCRVRVAPRIPTRFALWAT